ncbi:cytochrome c biogenesis protein [Novipirellula artificiosorum]|uniref:Cytochrome c biogenesis protein CcsA n=1 Tax=Novipirellula artificiosorum TaxID=2528016 RepID=A0A5C6E2U3_9BACT|nr:cytochrome c biogenesis protein CcsA [Novipirellula artificiosorum]TWU42287.1 Cytochrome c biogenesis protein CcsA [Novipirellula artificiosorum]
MATISTPPESPDGTRNPTAGKIGPTVLHWLGSLKLTVLLFAISLVLVLVGTLAQDQMNMLDVKNRYFLSWIAPLHLDDFFPQAFYRHEQPIPGVIPFPGGALVGALLMVNLIAAKITRFKIHASGSNLFGGIALLVIGTVVAGLIVSTGHSSDGLQGEPPMRYETLWRWVLAVLSLSTAGSLVAATKTPDKTVRKLLITVAVIVAAALVYYLVSGTRIGNPGLRIVWQLTKGLGAGLILLAGCRLVFDKQGGNVLLHLGVGLLMVGQFVFGDRQLEQNLSLVEGQSTNVLVNPDAVELAFIDRQDQSENVVAIPATRLLRAAASGEVLRDEALPVDVKVLRFFEHSTLKQADEDQSNLANRGIGKEVVAEQRGKSGGVENAVNLTAAYVELIDKDSDESLGTYMVSQLLTDRQMLSPGENIPDDFDSITVGDVSYQLALRYHREVKPYWVQLQDVRQVTYSGTTTPRDYSSFIRIIDKETGEDRKDRVWMNNPLRYRGETFYQSKYDTLPSGKEVTVLQVVRNAGWLIPYVACSIAGLGMLAHFLGTLSRFLARRRRENDKELAKLATYNLTPPSRMPVYVATAALGLFAVMMLVPWSAVISAMRPATRQTSFDFYAAGKIPTQFGGRIMPLDAYARQTLKAMSNKESLPLDEAPTGIQKRATGKRMTAMQWLMEVAVDDTQLQYLPMFRIDAEEVRSELGLERRESKLYSRAEILENWDKASKIVEAAFSKESIDQSFKEKKLIELDLRTRQYTVTAAAIRLPVPPQIPESFFPEGTDERTRGLFALRQLEMMMQNVEKMNSPSFIPPEPANAMQPSNDPKWSSFGPAFFEMAKMSAAGDVAPRVGIESFGDMIQAYRDEDPSKFNSAVDDHLAAVQDYPIRGYDKSLVSLERWMQANWPTGVAMAMYLVAMVLGLIYFMADLPRLREVVWGTLLMAMAIHTLAILCRVAITGRAPVINLYSSAVFIGWGSVLFGLIVERIFRYGLGNMLSAAAGVLTLLVAYGLDKGDTMPVLQAVLDTQFWLATHVISVTLGYVATLVAGTLGIGYLIAGWVGKDPKTLKDLYRMCYGAACFGILFSFVGTVLGGLWADDSWGRFWGWDPKENGALLIVIWNALMLHARWDGMVGAKGFSILAIGGNVVTAWSWFGTNELGIGLHSYGFTSGVLMWLSLFLGVQAIFIIAGLIAGKQPSDLLEG